MKNECNYCHEDWDKRLPIIDTRKEKVLIGKTNKLEVEIKENNEKGFSVYTSLEIDLCPYCGKRLKDSKPLEEVRDIWGDFYLQEDIEDIKKSKYVKGIFNLERGEKHD